MKYYKFWIEPIRIRSLKNALAIVRMLRANVNIKNDARFAILLDEHNQYDVRIKTRHKDTADWIQAELNSHQDLYNFYGMDEVKD